MPRHPLHSTLLRPSAAVLAGVVMLAFGACKRATSEDGAGAGKTPAVSAAQRLATTKELTANLEKALNAYNAGDQAGLFADFASTATPVPGERIFTDLFEGYYKHEFGKILAVRLNAEASVPDADFGMLVYLAQCERQPLVQVSANFVRENGTPKIVQLRIEALERAGK